MNNPSARRRYAIRLAAVAVVAGALGAAHALAASSTCSVSASAGFATCLSFTNPDYEQVRALQSSGLPYRFQLRRASDGATWGWWQYSDLNRHVHLLHLSGTIRAQVDNRASSGSASYAVEMG
jgi:hypothetical protein